MPSLEDVTIRTELRPGDIGHVIYLHGSEYSREYGYGIGFETYVAEGLLEFYRNYDPAKERVWVCEHGGRMVGFLLLESRGEAAQLRYFFILPEYRGIGLGKKLIGLYMDFYRRCGYRSSYLWTTSELRAAASLYTRNGFVLTESKPSTTFEKPVIEQRYELKNS